MNSPQALENRLQAVGRVLASDPDGLALLGLGSVGLELSRLDAWSDLDFFAIVRPGSKSRFLQDLGWLHRVHPVVYQFQNTPDGFKLLFEDGIFAEMAVFEPQELEHIPFAPGRVIWHHADCTPESLQPRNGQGRNAAPASSAYAAGELLTCLYVGMCRYHRGERLSAWRFIQSHCVDRYLELVELSETPQPGLSDAYSPDRRFELRYPKAAARLSQFITGYDSIAASALAMLAFLDEHTEVNPAMKRQIEALCQAARE